MHVPLETYEAALMEESLAIAGMRREGDFEALPVAFLEGEHPNIFHASITNVHMVVGDASPRLRKLEQRNPEFPRPLTDDLARYGAALASASMPVLHEEHMRGVADAVTAACEDLEEQASVLSSPFRIVGLQVVSINGEGRPFVYEHSSRAFAQAMSPHIPEVPHADLADLESVDDEQFRLAYDLQSEHQELGPYEEWKEDVIGSVAEALEGRDIDEGRATGYMEYLLLPDAQTHPTIGALFK